MKNFKRNQQTNSQLKQYECKHPFDSYGLPVEKYRAPSSLEVGPYMVGELRFPGPEMGPAARPETSSGRGRGWGTAMDHRRSAPPGDDRDWSLDSGETGIDRDRQRLLRCPSPSSSSVAWRSFLDRVSRLRSGKERRRSPIIVNPAAWPASPTSPRGKGESVGEGEQEEEQE